MDSEISQIQDFYNRKSVFITGATGFLGKVILEKMVRSCPGLDTIYILVREKKGKNPSERFKELLSSKVFDRVKQESPDSLSKIVLIFGDVSLPGMGLSESDMNKLLENVSVVFHVAALVKFMEPLDILVNMNVLGTRRVLELCQMMKNPAVFIHISTAYCNCDQSLIDEVVYPTVSPQKIIDITEWMTPEALEAVTPKIIGKHNVNYTYSKAIAETLVMEERGTVPTAILRPSAVCGAWKEPYPGWVDTINGIGGLVIGAGMGLVRTVYVSENKIFDFIPVDVFSNLTIAVGWHLATQRPSQLLVYNWATGSQEELTTKKMIAFMESLLFQYPPSKVYRFPSGAIRNSKISDTFHRVVQHYIPAMVVDTALVICWKKPFLFPLYRKIHKLVDISEYFANNNFYFKSSKAMELYHVMSKKDREIFDFDIRPLDWRQYLTDSAIGIRHYLMKEDPANLPQAKRNMLIRYYLSKFIDVAVIFGIWKFFLSNFLSVDMLWNGLSGNMEEDNQNFTVE